MKIKFKSILKIAVWSVLSVIILVLADMALLSLRYSPEFVVREYFMDLGDADDYLSLPSRELKASPEPFHFSIDKNKEAQVQDIFQSFTKGKDLDTVLETSGTWAFMVIKDDTIIYERYFQGYKPESPVTSFSVAKSFDSALVGIAIHEGYIQSAEDPITNYIPELLDRDPRFQNIQVRHLVMMASGLGYDDDRILMPEDDNLTYAFNDLRQLALTETKVQGTPGTYFLYNNYNPLLLGLILERATGRPVTTYLQEKIWTPIGMEYNGSWSLDSQESAFEKMESGINASPVDFAKFGRLYLNNGDWNGQQIVPSEWVALSTTDQGLLEDSPFYYGYMWFEKSCSAASNDFFALGHYGQFIYVSKANNMIIVRNGEKMGLPREELDWTDLFCQIGESLP